MKRIVIASMAALAIGVLFAGCGEETRNDSEAAIRDVPTEQSFVMTDAQKQSMLDALEERDRILSGSGGSRPPFVMTGAQRQSMLEALEERDRILSGYAEPGPVVLPADEPAGQFVPTEAQKQSMLEALAERDRILSGY